MSTQPSAENSTEPTPNELEVSGRRWLTISSSVAAAGVLTSLFGLPEVGGWLTVVGLATLALGLHRLGRSGADPPGTARGATDE